MVVHPPLSRLSMPLRVASADLGAWMIDLPGSGTGALGPLQGARFEQQGPERLLSFGSGMARESQESIIDIS
jgi:hypothetical protein